MLINPEAVLDAKDAKKNKASFAKGRRTHQTCGVNHSNIGQTPDMAFV